MAEILLKSTYINETNDTVRSPFTRVEAKARRGKQFLQLYGADPEIMLRAAHATVKKAPGLMKGHDTSQMATDNTGPGDWTAKQVNNEEQGHPEGRDTATKQK